MWRSTGWALILAAAGCLAQESPQAPTGARDLFYFGTAPKDDLPPIRKSAAVTNAPAAAHLGLRYSVLLANANGSWQPVDPDRSFRKGECLAMDLESNRSGYLYVLARQSDGAWMPLFPAAAAPSGSNRIDPGQRIRTPKGSCFEIEDPPGTENLFVVLSRSPQAIAGLIRKMQGDDSPTHAPVQSASARSVDDGTVEDLAAQYGTRDLVYRQIVSAPSTQKASSKSSEPEHAVYVVNGSGKALSTVVTKVAIRHQ